MAREGARPEAIRRLSADEERCIWMGAGLLSFRLCDRGFDCAACPLDAALTGREAPAAPLPGAATTVRGSSSVAEEALCLVRVASTRFPVHDFLSPCHLWARVEDRGNVRTGLDEFGARLLRGLREVRPVRSGTELRPGDPLCRVVWDGGTSCLAAPLGGVVLSVNRSLTEDPMPLRRDPYDEGWLAVLEPSHLVRTLRTLFYGAEAAAWYRREAGRLSQTLAGGGGPGGRAVLADGGVPLPAALGSLAPGEIRRIADEFLGAPPSEAPGCNGR